MINRGKMLKNRRKSSNTPNSAKIPRAQLCKWFQQIASTQKPCARKKNFGFISHRKKVRVTISGAWRPFWNWGPGAQSLPKLAGEKNRVILGGISERMKQFADPQGGCKATPRTCPPSALKLYDIHLRYDSGSLRNRLANR